MATHESIQGSLDPHLRGARITRSVFRSSTAEDVYVVGGTLAPSRSRWVTINPSQTAAQQAAAIIAGLLA